MLKQHWTFLWWFIDALEQYPELNEETDTIWQPVQLMKIDLTAYHAAMVNSGYLYSKMIVSIESRILFKQRRQAFVGSRVNRGGRKQLCLPAGTLKVSVTKEYSKYCCRSYRETRCESSICGCGYFRSINRCICKPSWLPWKDATALGIMNDGNVIADFDSELRRRFSFSSERHR